MKPILNRLKNILMRRALTQQLASRLAGELRPEKWIFVIGCYNSGTTLLAHLLERHSDIRSLPGEGVAFTDGLLRPEEFGWPRMWIKCQSDLEVDAADEAKLAARIKRHWSWAAIGKGNCVLEKSIANVTRLDFLNANFNPAYFIHITRNGYAVAEGIRRKADPKRWDNPAYEDRYPLELCAQQWQVTEDLIESKKTGLDRYYSLRYEDLVESPAEQVKKILDFAGLAWDEQILDGNIRVHGTTGPIENMNQKSLQNLSDSDKATVSQTAGDCLVRLGYCVDSVALSD